MYFLLKYTSNRKSDDVLVPRHEFVVLTPTPPSYNLPKTPNSYSEFGVFKIQWTQLI